MKRCEKVISSLVRWLYFALDGFVILEKKASLSTPPVLKSNGCLAKSQNHPAQSIVGSLVN
jgi:hypothetical protein